MAPLQPPPQLHPQTRSPAQRRPVIGIANADDGNNGVFMGQRDSLKLLATILV